MRVTEKGQVTIPKNVRSNLGIEAGSEVEFVLREGEAVLRLIKPSRDQVDRDVRELIDHLRRHQGSMSLGEMSGEEFYRLLRD
ncbi:AbrB/MazE/SpoVT family DNA-binding domain-containing protein [Rhizobium sp. P32RR-XVIII]|uniref:AbrB/MazE/SpoVT family DNA-binding domain-containing protein n=1 Tax=Rhizobium sp. P32RR-XVIII TaxID=2726738 RepID=UPI001456C557|nr:AbrB/MazE/SpoVT family DNA-binding domain-containing protein [Rhizobium sp. P32RR-XVIII]NLS02247.1 AbrB/MazE/SpoVT family DNA-binding domain-containing protein [Rhizobium sp. P32RR-XVIII]